MKHSKLHKITVFSSIEHIKPYKRKQTWYSAVLSIISKADHSGHTKCMKLGFRSFIWFHDCIEHPEQKIESDRLLIKTMTTDSFQSARSGMN